MSKVGNEGDRYVEVGPKGMLSCKGGLNRKLLIPLEYSRNIVVRGGKNV
jgi:hypothetical protein